MSKGKKVWEYNCRGGKGSLEEGMKTLPKKVAKALAIDKGLVCEELLWVILQGNEEIFLLERTFLQNFEGSEAMEFSHDRI